MAVVLSCVVRIHMYDICHTYWTPHIETKVQWYWALRKTHLYFCARCVGRHASKYESSWFFHWQPHVGLVLPYALHTVCVLWNRGFRNTFSANVAAVGHNSLMTTDDRLKQPWENFLGWILTRKETGLRPTEYCARRDRQHSRTVAPVCCVCRIITSN